jgi:hypothetical protein
MNELTFAKPSKKKSCLDMRDLPLGKTNRSQRINKQARKITDRCKCEYPGCGKWAQEAKHHAIQKSDTVIDHSWNLIRFCDLHHGQADEFEITPVDVFELIAHRENKTVEKILSELSGFCGRLCYIDGEHVKVQKPVLQRINHGNQKETTTV